MKTILAYDLGSTSVKTCLFRVGETVELIASATKGYNLYTLPNGGAEQHLDEWWEAMCGSTHAVLSQSGADGERIDGISFCSQMQGLVLVDEEGHPVRHPMSYMDQRAGEEMHEGIASGVKVAGMNARRLLTSLRITGAVSASVKDPMWKYLWVKNHEPAAFQKARWWLDVKEALIAHMTGICVQTRDSAYATMLYDTREGSQGWSRQLADMFGVDMKHLPRIIGTAEVAGELRPEQAKQLGVAPGIPVFGGGGDASLTGIGAGCVDNGQTHIYWGTSGWVSTITDKQSVDTGAMMASIVGAQDGLYNYFAEMETAGKSVEWARNQLATEEESYENITDIIKRTEPGAGGVIFAPWLHGNRCPFEDPNSTGIFLGLSLDTGKAEMIRAVAEGVCYHMRWMLECQGKKIKTSDPVRFCGGGALSSVISQVLADILGRTVEVPEGPQNTGALGAALTAAVGLGAIRDIEQAGKLIRVKETYLPQKEYEEVYQRNYSVFKKLYRSNKGLFGIMASRRG